MFTSWLILAAVAMAVPWSPGPPSMPPDAPEAFYSQLEAMPSPARQEWVRVMLARLDRANQVLLNPWRSEYRDIATTPPSDEDLDTLELYTSSSSAVKAVERIKKYAKARVVSKDVTREMTDAANDPDEKQHIDAAE